MSDKKPVKRLKPVIADREKSLLDMAGMIGFLTVDIVEAQKKYAIAHNDKLCSVRTPTAADRRDVAIALRRFEMLSKKRIAVELALQKLVDVPALRKDPHKTLGQ